MLVSSKSDLNHQPRLINDVRSAIRVRHYSWATEKTYVHWIIKFAHFHGLRHPAEMGEKEVSEFINHLAVHEKVSASTQNSPREI